jgi:hypothetical protein
VKGRKVGEWQSEKHYGIEVQCVGMIARREDEKYILALLRE